MTITNGYVLLEDVKSALRVQDSDDDVMIELAIESASRAIDGHCGRHFYAESEATARTFVASSSHLCHVDDISTTDGLIVKTDTTGAGTFGITWTANDYQLEPLNGRRSGQAWAYDTIIAVGAHYFPKWGTLNRGEALVQVTATWGWPAIPEPVRQATLIQAVSLFKGKDAPLGVAGFGDVGAIRMSSMIHPQALMLLKPFRRTGVLVA
jgi:hypothetical protein